MMYVEARYHRERDLDFSMIALNPLPFLHSVMNYCPLTGCHLLIWVESKDPIISKGAGFATFVFCTLVLHMNLQ